MDTLIQRLQKQISINIFVETSRMEFFSYATSMYLIYIIDIIKPYTKTNTG